MWVKPIVSCLMTDCKSLYDKVNPAVGTGSQTDETAAVDIAVPKEHLKRLQVPLRWCPTQPIEWSRTA